jgi:hypothetical protein
MGELVRDRLPDAVEYFTVTAGLVLIGPARSKWKTTSCTFHGGKDSMRIHVERGGFICMSCGAKGGDILAYHMAANGMGFVDAARSLGAYQEDDKPHQGGTKPTPISARLLLASVATELTVASVIASDMAKNKALSEADAARLQLMAGRIAFVAEAANVH